MSDNNSTPLSAKPALLGLTLDELTAVAVELGLPRFVGKQLCGWIYDKHARSFDEMTNLSKAARARLAETYVLGISTPVESVESRDGTIKYLFRTAKGHYIESVFIPDGERATEALTATWGYAWSPKRITVSTVGVAKGLRRFLDESKCSLAVSLHHPDAAERGAMMPAERAFGVEALIELLSQYDFCRKTTDDYAEGTKQRRLTFEYIVFRGINDTLEHGRALVRLLAPLDCRINMIRFHTIPDTRFDGTDETAMLRLQDYLNAHGITTTVRASRGQDIYAACGMLTTKRMEEERA